jgi:hypothetical protein
MSIVKDIVMLFTTSSERKTALEVFTSYDLSKRQLLIAFKLLEIAAISKLGNFNAYYDSHTISTTLR